MIQNDYNLKFKEIILKYEKKINCDNIYYIDPIKHKDMILNHYLKLSKEDLFMRFNFIINKYSIEKYIISLSKKNSFILGYIKNDEIIGICETVQSENDLSQVEIGISVINSFRKNNIGKNLFIHSFFIANQLSYNKIRVDFLRKNEIILSWIKSLNLAYNNNYNEAYLIFPTFYGNIENIKKYKER